MTTTTNLGLELPEGNENVSRIQLNSNMTKIDDAFGGGEDITSQLTYVDCSYVAGGVFKLGKLVFVQLRVEINGTFSGAKTFLRGFPIPVNSNGKNLVFFSHNHMVQNNNNIYINTNGDQSCSTTTSQFSNGETLALNASYVCE